MTDNLTRRLRTVAKNFCVRFGLDAAAEENLIASLNELVEQAADELIAARKPEKRFTQRPKGEK